MSGLFDHLPALREQASHDLDGALKQAMEITLKACKEAVFKPNPAPLDGKWCCERCPDLHRGEVGAVEKTLSSLKSIEEKYAK